MLLLDSFRVPAVIAVTWLIFHVLVFSQSAQPCGDLGGWVTYGMGSLNKSGFIIGPHCLHRHCHPISDGGTEALWCVGVCGNWAKAYPVVYSLFGGTAGSSLLRFLSPP